MRFSKALIALVVPFLVSAAPAKRQSTSSSSSSSNSNSQNLLVLNFALVLEQLETQFYTQALQKFQANDFIEAGFSSAEIAIQQFTSIMTDESSHIGALESAIQALGSTPISGCSFDFSSVLTDVTTMASVARLVENVGVGAYLGAAQLVTDPSILTAAASILTIEARHQSILNIFNGGTAIPQSFDIPLLPQEVLAIAGGFISGCTLPITALPALTVTNSGPIVAGTSLTFSSSAMSNVNPSTLSCQMLVGGAPTALALPFNQCVVPNNINGPVAIFLTSDSQPLNNNPRDQSVSSIVAGPTMAFIDGQPQVLSQVVRSGVPAAASSNSSTSTNSGVSSNSGVGNSGVSNSGVSNSQLSTVSIASASGANKNPSATSSLLISQPTAPAAQAASSGGSSSSVTTGPVDNGAITVLGVTNVSA